MKHDVASFRIGTDNLTWIQVDVLQYERAYTGVLYDDNWLDCRIGAQAGAFRGNFRASLLAMELASLHHDVARLYDTLRGEVAFTSLEHYLHLHLSCDDRGHIHLDGRLSDQPGTGQTLHVSMAFDQTYLHQFVRDLGRTVSAFPVRS